MDDVEADIVAEAEDAEAAVLVEVVVDVESHRRLNHQAMVSTVKTSKESDKSLAGRCPQAKLPIQEEH